MKLGMDPVVARTTRDAMQAQVAALTAIAAELSASYEAASSPASHGMEPGETTIAPWSLPAVQGAAVQVESARSAASALLQRITTEADAQNTTSGNDPIFGESNSVMSVLGTASDVWGYATNPATLLGLPFSASAATNPGVARWALNPRNWGPAGTVRAADQMSDAARGLGSTGWQGFVRGSYQAGANVELQNLIDPNFVPSLGRHASPTAGRWTNFLHVGNPKVLSGMQTAVSGVGKAFGVLGVVSSGLQLGQGILGMTDGDVSSEDAWAAADGAVGLITGVGSFAPPPVGTVFTAVGLGYTAGRWLLGADENGQTGLDKIGDWGQSAGTTVGNAVGAVGDAAESVGDFVEDVWPW